MCYASPVPTVLRIDGLRVMMFPNDHPPPHVHVFGNGGEAQFYLNCPLGPPTLRDRYRLSKSEVNRIGIALQPHIPQLCAIWEEIHDNQ
jgi:hypothetical protein